MYRYNNIEETKSPTGKQMYKTVRYPEIPRLFSDIYVYSTVGDRYDTLALTYYKNSSLWWIISISNGDLNQNSLIPPPGVQLRIPSNPTPIIASYNKINS
jgi:hypothetical protein